MAVKVVIPLDGPDAILDAAAYGAGSDLELQRDTTPAFSAPAAVADIAIVTGTYLYEHWDAGGTTSSWYRWRLTNTGDTETGEWSDPFQGWDPAVAARKSGAYATLDDALRVLPQKPGERSSDRLARIETALVDATDQLDDALKLRHAFFRSPQSGADEVRTFDGPGGRVLHLHAGLVELTSLRIKRSIRGDWETVDVDDVRLEYWANLGSNHEKPDDEPYDHVVMTGAGTELAWPCGPALVELTGAYQWPRVWRRATRVVVDWARQQLAADPSAAGGPTGPIELGRPVGTIRMPDSVFRFVTAMNQRHWCHL